MRVLYFLIGLLLIVHAGNALALWAVATKAEYVLLFIIGIVLIVDSVRPIVLRLPKARAIQAE